MSKQSEAKYLADMLEYAQKALEISVGADADRFDNDETLRFALAYLIQIVGEAASRTSEATRAALPSVPWAQIIGMRYRLVHGYGEVSYNVVWDVLQRDLPMLIAALERFESDSL